MKAFVTGSTGYIGSHLVNALIRRGYSVNALCRSVEKSKAIEQEGVEIIVGDLSNRDALIKGMENCSVVFHVAAMAKVWDKDSGSFYRINVEGTKNILDASVLGGVSRVVFTSTGGIYGASLKGTITEDSVRQLDFFNEYEGSKCLAESWVKDYVIRGLDVVIVSPTRVYGPYLFGEPESVTKMVKAFVKQSWRWIPGPVDKLGNYVFIDDVVNGHILAMEKGVKGSTYILGGSNHSYMEFFQLLRSLSGINRRLFPMPLWIIRFVAYVNLKSAQLFGIEPVITPKWVAKAKYDWKVDASKAHKELGMTITPLREGLQRTIDWIRS